jgi:hypothetical protein
MSLGIEMPCFALGGGLHELDESLRGFSLTEEKLALLLGVILMPKQLLSDRCYPFVIRFPPRPDGLSKGIYESSGTNSSSYMVTWHSYAQAYRQ